MNSRIFSIAAVVTLVALSSGCGCMKNFLFGKGARCGLCNSNAGGIPAPQFGNTMQAPCGAQPYTQPFAAPQQNCGSEQYVSAPHAGGGYSCGTCGSASAGDCGCGNVDPYMSGGAVGVPQAGPTMAPIQGDGFSARRFDNDGSRILWEEPYYGGTSL